MFAKLLREFRNHSEPIQKPTDTPADDAPKESDKPAQEKPAAKQLKRGHTQGINLFPTFLHETPQKFANLGEAWDALHRLSADELRDFEISVKQARDYKNMGCQAMA